MCNELLHHNIAYDLISPNIPAGGSAPGKKLYLGDITHQSFNAPPCFLRLLAVFLHMGDNDLVDIFRPPLGLPLGGKQA